MLALFLAVAAPSMAAKAEVAWTGDKYGSWAILYVTAAAGERNDIVVTQTGGALRVTDSGPVTDGGSCDVQPDGSAVCHGSGLALADLRIDAGDLDDRSAPSFGKPICRAAPAMTC